MGDPEIAAICREEAAAHRAHELQERREPQDFDEPLCDAPGFFDPLHRDEVSVRCALIKGHPGNHHGYMPAEWSAERQAEATMPP